MIWLSFRHSTARVLASMADRVFQAPPDRAIPTMAELAPLEFDDVWTRLIDAVRPWRVQGLDLVLYRNEQRTTEYAWVDPDGDTDPNGDPNGAAIDANSWSLGMSFPKSDGRRCELRATIPAVATPDPVSMLGLTKVLRTFGIRFGIEVEPHPGLSLLRADEERSEAVAAERPSRAA